MHKSFAIVVIAIILLAVGYFVFRDQIAAAFKDVINPIGEAATECLHTIPQ